MAAGPSAGGGLRRVGRLVVAGALAGASLALPACGGDPEPAAPPASPGAAVDPGATSGVGGVINKAKGTAAEVESRDATVSSGP